MAQSSFHVSIHEAPPSRHLGFDSDLEIDKLRLCFVREDDARLTHAAGLSSEAGGASDQ